MFRFNTETSSAQVINIVRYVKLVKIIDKNPIFKKYGNFLTKIQFSFLPNYPKFNTSNLKKIRKFASFYTVFK
ncbi:MAG: hypothetical protein COA67_09400 [Lutibacter sp.]|nr:MAG: hypothetical protein COA67_09400 [Lutibacter sp.]